MRRRQSQQQAEAADAVLLRNRLERLGLHGVAGVEVHANRTVLVTVTKRRMLRVHRGFAYASDRVLSAIVKFVSAMTSSGRRRAAQRTIVAADRKMNYSGFRHGVLRDLKHMLERARKEEQGASSTDS